MKRKASAEMINSRWKACVDQQEKVHQLYEQTVAMTRMANDTLLEDREECGSDVSSSSPAKSPSAPEDLPGIFDHYEALKYGASRT